MTELFTTLVHTGNVNLTRSLKNYFNYVQNNNNYRFINCYKDVDVLFNEEWFESEGFNLEEQFHCSVYPIIESQIGNLFYDNSCPINCQEQYEKKKDRNSISELKNKLEQIASKIKGYYLFYNEIKKNPSDYKIHWNTPEIKQPGKEQKILYLFNIQEGNKDFWTKISKSIFELNSLADILFIFYYNCENRCKKSFEAKNPSWGYSRFIRDFLKHPRVKKSIEINIDDLIGKDEKLDNGIWDVYRVQIEKSLETKISINLKQIYSETTNKIFKSLQVFIPALKEEKIKKLLLNFYLQGRNKKLFTKSEETELIEALKVIGTTSTNLKVGHDLPGAKYDILFKENFDLTIDSQSLGASLLWEFIVKGISTLTEMYFRTDNTLSNEEIKVCFIDDNFNLFKDKVEALKKIWFHNCELGLLTRPNISGKLLEQKDDENNKFLKEYDIVIVDLDFGGELKGFEILRNLRSEIKKLNEGKSESKNFEKAPLIIVLSRNEDPTSIRNSLNNGALIYVTKNNLFELIPAIYQLLPTINGLKNIDKKSGLLDKLQNYKSYENWHYLEKLPPSKILELKTYIIEGKSYTPFNKEKKAADLGFDEKVNFTDDEYQWIQKLPKADIHCHFGSCLGSDLLPKTAFLVLAEKFKIDKVEKKVDEDFLKKRIEKIIEFLFPIAFDPYLDESKVSKRTRTKTKSAVFWANYKYTFIFNTRHQFINQSIFHIISDSFPLQKHNKTPEEVLLSPKSNLIEEYYTPLSKYHLSEFYKRRQWLKENNVSYDEIMLYFVLLLGLREFIDKKNEIRVAEYLNQLIIYIEQILSEVPNKEIVGQPNQQEEKKEESGGKKKLFEFDFLNDFKNIIQKQIEEIKSQKVRLSPYKNSSILKFLQSAHSEKRCLPIEGRGLLNYLRGCEYGGAPHLQSKASLYLAANYIINEYAKKDNIRYLCLRCALDGYSKFNLQKKVEVVSNLLDAFDYFTKEKNEKIHINVIITAKRHKSIKEFEENVLLALEYRNNKTKNEEEDSSQLMATSIFETKTDIVSFDLAGLEEGNRASKFQKKFEQLFKACFPITIHAGEEDDDEAIWEAVYVAHSQRLGHALSLNNNRALLNIVRDRQIVIELCPISNYLTQNRYSFDKKDLKNKIAEDYPLTHYLNDNLIVTINTDNPVVSDTNMTKEYLFASKLVGGLTKWEILRLIKNGFRSAAISKTLKRKLMNEIDDEIYEILLNED